MTIKRCYSVLVGATVDANQLAREFSAENWLGNNATVTFTNGVAEMTPNGLYGQLIQYQSKAPNITSGHKYLISFSAKSSGGTNVYRVYNVSGTQYTNMIPGTNYARYGAVINEANSGSGIRIIFQNNSSDYETLYVKDLIFVDLTALLGSTIADYIYSIETATAGAGIAKLHEWGFIKDEYIPYNAGTLESVEATAHKMVGFNQWDEVWEVGYIVPSTGELNNRTDRIRTKNYIPVIGGTGYYFHTLGMIMNCIWYDANHNYIRNNSPNNEVITSPQNARYCKFSMPSDYGTTYNHDICINLSSDRNGEYEPYTSQTYALGSDTLRGIFKLDSNNQLYADGDRKEADGTITRKYGVVDLGTLNWTMYETNYLYANLPDAKIGMYAQLSNAMCSKYAQSTMSLLFDKTFAINNGQSRINIYDSTYSDAATFKTAMSGVMLVYELATPTTEQSTPFTSPQLVYPDGTEEFVTETGVPVGHVSKYQL